MAINRELRESMGSARFGLENVSSMYDKIKRNKTNKPIEYEH